MTTRDEYIVKVSEDDKTLATQHEKLCFQAGAVWADKHPYWLADTAYLVTVSGHASNKKGSWLYNYAKETLNGILVMNKNVDKLQARIETIIGRANELFPRATYSQMRTLHLGVNNDDISFNIYTRKGSDYADVNVLLTPVTLKMDWLL